MLKTYLENLPENNPYLFPSNQNKPKPISASQVGNLLRALAQKASIKITNGKRLSFHCFRKMFLSASIDSGIGLTAGKILCGKTVDSSDSTYLTTVKLRQHFIQLKKFLTINQQPEIDTDKIECLQKTIVELQEDLTSQKIIDEAITKKSLEQKLELETLKKGQTILEKKVDKIMTTLFSKSFDDLVKTSLETISDLEKKG